MPTLLGAAELEALQRRGRGATQARMLRELAEAMEALTAERPLILVLEDLQWSDYATLEWLAFVARRREKAGCSSLGPIGRWTCWCARIPCGRSCRNSSGTGSARSCHWRI